MKIFIDTDIMEKSYTLNGKTIDSPILRSKYLKKSPLNFSRKTGGLTIGEIISMQHPVTLSWMITSFILLSGLYIYSSKFIN